MSQELGAPVTAECSGWRQAGFDSQHEWQGWLDEAVREDIARDAVVPAITIRDEDDLWEDDVAPSWELLPPRYEDAVAPDGGVTETYVAQFGRPTQQQHNEVAMLVTSMASDFQDLAASAQLDLQEGASHPLAVLHEFISSQESMTGSFSYLSLGGAPRITWHQTGLDALTVGERVSAWEIERHHQYAAEYAEGETFLSEGLMAEQQFADDLLRGRVPLDDSREEQGLEDEPEEPESEYDSEAPESEDEREESESAHEPDETHPDDAQFEFEQSSEDERFSSDERSVNDGILAFSEAPNLTASDHDTDVDSGPTWPLPPIPNARAHLPRRPFRPQRRRLAPRSSTASSPTSLGKRSLEEAPDGDEGESSDSDTSKRVKRSLGRTRGRRRS